MLFRVLKESIGYSDIPDLQARVEIATRGLSGDEEKYQAIKNLLDADTALIPALVSGSQRDKLTTVWANTLLYDGFDGDFTNLLLSMVGQDDILSNYGDKIMQLWLLYDERRLNLSDGIIPPEEFYSHPALYKDTSDDDFEYLVNAEMIVNHNEKVRRYVKATPSQDDIRKVFFKGFGGSQGLHTAEEVYQNIEELSAKYGENDGLMRISDAVEKESGADFDKMKDSSIVSTLKEYVGRYIGQIDNVSFKSDSGYSVNDYQDAIEMLSHNRRDLESLIDAKVVREATSKEIALAIMGWLEKNRMLERIR